MSADHRGLPLIAGLCALCSALTTWNAADLVATVSARRAAIVAERNLDQAEDMLKACFRHAIFVISTDIYRCEAHKSRLTTAQVPEVLGMGG